MTLLISTIGKSRGWISQDSLIWVPPRWNPFGKPTRQVMGRKVVLCPAARMAIGFSGGDSWKLKPVALTGRKYKNFDAYAHDLPLLWGSHRPGLPCQIVAVGWSDARQRIMAAELYVAPGAEPAFEQVEHGTKTDDDLDINGLHYGEIRKLVMFADVDPPAAKIERLHTLIAENVVDASRRGHYGRPFAGPPIDFACVSESGVTVRQLDLDAQAAASDHAVLTYRDATPRVGLVHGEAEP